MDKTDTEIEVGDEFKVQYGDGYEAKIVDTYMREADNKRFYIMRYFKYGRGCERAVTEEWLIDYGYPEEGVEE